MQMQKGTVIKLPSHTCDQHKNTDRTATTESERRTNRCMSCPLNIRYRNKSKTCVVEERTISTLYCACAAAGIDTLLGTRHNISDDIIITNVTPMKTFSCSHSITSVSIGSAEITADIKFLFKSKLNSQITKTHKTSNTF